MASVLERRARLDPRPNPGIQFDCLVFWQTQVPPQTALLIYYVPDRLISTPPAFEAYFQSLATETWDVAETLATTVLDDINNELIPRWARVVTRSPSPEATPFPATCKTALQCVMIEDQQPGWRNPDLLSRLAPFDLERKA
ncbi:MLTR_LBD domain-containing protein [Azospirillaceae bacterium]